MLSNIFFLLCFVNSGGGGVERDYIKCCTVFGKKKNVCGGIQFRRKEKIGMETNKALVLHKRGHLFLFLAPKQFAS